MQSFIYARYRCVIVGGIPYNIIGRYRVLVYCVLLLNHLYWLSFHLLTLSMMISAAVHTTQKEKNIRVGLKID